MKNNYNYGNLLNDDAKFSNLSEEEKNRIKRHLNYVSYFKSNNFILGQSYNYCSREIIDLEPDVMKYPYENFDHEYIMCDPHYSMPGRPYSLIKGSYSYLKRCLYGKDTSYWVLDYGKKFLKTYNKNKKFLRLGFQDGHEGTGEIVGYLDDLLLDFLLSLDFDNTAVLLHSDHGLNMPGFYSGFEMEQFWIEKNTPFLYLVLPKKDKKLNKLKVNLKNNENLLVTAFDINNTFKSLAGVSGEFFNEEGMSLFYPITNKSERTCGKFRVKSEDCRCKTKD